MYHKLNLLVFVNKNFICKQINPIENILHFSFSQISLILLYSSDNYNSGDK